MPDNQRQWSQTDKPWLRQELDASKGWCPFCGNRSTILSMTDHEEDTGRIEVYCKSDGCEAREITILRMRGEDAGRRADVRVLQELDYPTSERPASYTLGELLDDPHLADGVIAGRRVSRDAVEVRLRNRN